jgi:nitronate monooxygenase
MFLVSGQDLVLAACRAGIVGAFPANNARTVDTLEQWFATISRTLPPDAPPWAVNIMVHRTYSRTAEELELAVKYRAPIVITALGSPKAIVDTVRGYGGLVFADVNSVTHARKAAAAGVDGLVLVSAGAGGHTGPISAFAFVPEVREFFDGVIVVGGAIGSGRAIRAAEVLGADLAYLGTRFIASTESMASAEYKSMLIEAGAEDIVLSAAISGVPANWLKASLIRAGIDPTAPPARPEMNLGRPEDTGKKKWKDVWSAGQGVGVIHAVEPVGAIVDRLVNEYIESGGAASITAGTVRPS